MDKYLQENEHRIKKISQLYYGLYVMGTQSTDVDVSDLEQAGRIAILDISRKRPEKLNHRGYVSAAIKYAMINEIKKMSHKKRQVYLAYQHEEEVPIIDVLPTTEAAPDRLNDINDLLYQIKNEFSPKEADALDSLVQGCRDVYDLNLSAPLSTDTKDRVKVVTAMDLNDEEMMIYAQVLTGARHKFPDGFCTAGGGGQERAKKYFEALLKTLKTDAKGFGLLSNKRDLLRRYRLISFLEHSFEDSIPKLIISQDSTINLEDIKSRGKKWDTISTEELIAIIHRLKEKLRKSPSEINSLNFADNNLEGMCQQVFNSSMRLAVEFAFPGTYPLYKHRAIDLRKRFDQKNRSSNKVL